MPERDHDEIMRNVPPLKLPAQRTSVAPTATPTCERDCSGRHETDGVIVCVRCGRAKYQVVLHEWRHQNGHYFTSMEPMNGAPPKRGPEDLRCCGQHMTRAWKA